MQTLELTKMSAVDVQTANALLGTARAVTVTMAGEQHELQITAPTTSSPTIRVQLRVGPHECWIEAGDPNKLPQLSRLLGGTELCQLPIDLQPAVLEAAFETELETLGRLTDSIWQIERLVDSVPEGVLRLGLALAIVSDRVWRGNLAIPTDCRSTISQLLAACLPLETTDLSDLPLTGGLTIASTQLTTEELLSLEIGDVIVLPGDVDGEVSLRFGNIVLIGTLEGEVLTVSSFNAVLQSPESTEGVSVAFDRGCCVVNPKELAGIVVGDTLTVTLHKDCPVGIVANGLQIGFGELVRLGKRNGVRVTTNASADS